MTGAAWLSSARALRCSVKSANERNPHHMLYFHVRLPVINRRKVGMTSNQHGPYAWGHTHNTMAYTNRSEAAMWSESEKISLSSDCSLQLDYMKLESLVNVYQSWHVEYVPGSCTHRPSRHGSWGHPKSAKQSWPKVNSITGLKS